MTRIKNTAAKEMRMIGHGVHQRHHRICELNLATGTARETHADVTAFISAWRARTGVTPSAATASALTSAVHYLDADFDTLRRRTDALAAFLRAAADRYGLTPRRLVAVGFSNGANIAATMLQLRPEALGGAILLRAMVVLDQPATPGSLTGGRVLLLNGQRDPLVPPDHPSRLAGHLRAGGATVSLAMLPHGHGLNQADLAAAKTWLTP